MIRKSAVLTKHIGFRVRESVFREIDCQAESDGKSPNDWCRDRILLAMKPSLPTPSHHALLAEIAATQDIAIGLLCALGRDGNLTTQKAQEIVDAAHKRKYRDVAALLKYAYSRIQNGRIRQPGQGE
ncbi:MAG: hypothetical protein ACRD18_17920 [Terriglobia bacterium]